MDLDKIDRLIRENSARLGVDYKLPPSRLPPRLPHQLPPQLPPRLPHQQPSRPPTPQPPQPPQRPPPQLSRQPPPEQSFQSNPIAQYNTVFLLNYSTGVSSYTSPLFGISFYDYTNKDKGELLKVIYGYLMKVITHKILSIPSTDIINYFLKSLFIYSLKKELCISYNYDIISINTNTEYSIEVPRNGLLSKTSANCLHTIIGFSNTGKTIKNLIFVKVVDYDNDNTDLIIFDVINSYYFNILLDEINSLSNHISKYLYSFLSYYNSISEANNYWNYNDILYISNSPNPNSIYNPTTHLFDRLLQESRENKYKKAYILMTEAIHHISIFKLFNDISKFSKYYSHIDEIFKYKFESFFELMLLLGIRYGFHHNDLHSTNLIYILTTKEIGFIDLGRSCFMSLQVIKNEKVDEYLQREIITLNYDVDSKLNKIFNKIKTYSDLFKLDNKLISYFNENIFYTNSTNPSQPIYLMIVFDLIQLTLTMYPRLLQFLDTLHSKVVIQQYFNNILQYLNKPINENIYEINNRSLDIVSLLQSYQRNCDYLNLIDSSDRLYPYVKTDYY